MEDFVGAKLHVLADRNQRVQIREKMLEFSSSVLSTPSSYLLFLSRKVSKVIYKKIYISMKFSGLTRLSIRDELVFVCCSLPYLMALTVNLFDQK